MATYPSLTYANLLDNATREELEQLLALLQGWLSTEHKDDGTHKAVTADSVEVSGDVSVTGDLAVSGDITASESDTVKTVVSGTVTTGRNALGPGVTLQAASGDRMAILCETAVGGPQLKIVDLDSSTLSYILRVFLGGGGYALSPSAAMTAATGVDLGVNASGERFNNIYGENLRANTAVYGPIEHLTGYLAPAQITANQNNYNPTGLSATTHLRINSDAARSITGIAAQAHGRMLWISNGGGFDITLVNNSASSTAGNRIVGANGSDVVIRANNGSVLLRYDTNVSGGFWLVLGA